MTILEIAARLFCGILALGILTVAGAVVLAGLATWEQRKGG